MNLVFNCKFCNKEKNSQKSIIAHQAICSNNPSAKYKPKYPSRKGEPPWNKGLTRHENEIVNASSIKISERMKKLVEDGKYKKIINSDEWKKRTSLRQSTKNSGGRCQWFDVGGVYVQGTWEYNVALKLNELNIRWEKLKTKEHVLFYKKDGKIKTYCPDFYLPDFDIYLEIKGYWWGDDQEKMSLVKGQNPLKNIFIMEKKDYIKFISGEIVWNS